MTTYQINEFIYTNVSNEFSNGEIQNTLSMLFDSLQILEIDGYVDEINFEIEIDGIEMINNFHSFNRSESCDSILSDASTVVN